MELKISLAIRRKAYIENEDTAILFDPKERMESVSDKCFKFVDIGLEQPGAMICLDFYKRLVSKELLEKLD